MSDLKLPRVSEILRAVGLAPDYFAVPEARLDAARERGIARHEAIAADHYGYLEPEQEPLLGGYRRFLADTGHKPLVSEALVENRVWGYRGHVDRFGDHNGNLVVVDWKPWSTDLRAASYQIAAYRAWCNSLKQDWQKAQRTVVPWESPITTGLVVELTDDAYRLTDVTEPDPHGRWPGLDAAWSVFQAALVVYRAQQEMRR